MMVVKTFLLCTALLICSDTSCFYFERNCIKSSVPLIQISSITTVILVRSVQAANSKENSMQQLFASEINKNQSSSLNANAIGMLMEAVQDIFDLNSFLHFNLIFVTKSKFDLQDVPFVSKFRDVGKFGYFQFSFVPSLKFLYELSNSKLNDKFESDFKPKNSLIRCDPNSVIVTHCFSLREAQDFIDQVELFYASKYHLWGQDARICSPIFLIVITSASPSKNTKTSNSPTAQKLDDFSTTFSEDSAEMKQLKEWALRFNIASQVYIVFTASTDENESGSQNSLVPTHTNDANRDSLRSSNSNYKVFEIYQVKKTPVVQDIFEPLSFTVLPIPKDNPSIDLMSMQDADLFNPRRRNDSSTHRFTLEEYLEQKTIRRSNFRQAQVIGINVDHPDYGEMVKYKYSESSENSGQPRQPMFDSGLGVLEYRFLRDALNFSELAATWPSYLKRGPNGTLIGLAIPLNNESADISISASEFLEYRFSGPDGITYLQPTFHNEITVFFKQPSAGSIRDVYLQTFSPDLWLTLACTWTLIFTSLLSAFLIKRRAKRKRIHFQDRQMFRDSLLWCFSSVCQQGWYTSPHSASLRIIFILGVFLGLITYLAYSAALVSILSVPVVPIRAFKDLLSSNFHILSDNHIPTAHFVVKNLEDTHVLQALPNDERNIEVSQNIRNLVRSKKAVVTMSDAFYPVLIKRGYDPRFICSSLSKVFFPGRPAVSSMLIKRGSPLREFLNYKVIMMKERGITFRLRNHYLLATTVKCLDTDVGKVQILSIKDVSTAFIFLFVGVSVSCVLFGLEKLWRLSRSRSYTGRSRRELQSTF